MLIEWIMLVWFIVLGCCIGSFLNVVILRLPEGKEFIKKPSHCPVCGHTLAWYDNIPLISWLLLLRGKCRYCKTPISAQYPLIEAVTGVIFGLVFWLCYFSGLWPVFSEAGLIATWPVYLCLILGFSALIVITVIDLKLYVVVLSVPCFTVGFLLILFPLIAALFPGTQQGLILPPHVADTSDVALRLEHVRPEGYANDFRVQSAVSADPPVKLSDLRAGHELTRVQIGSVPITGPVGVGVGFGGVLGFVLSLLLLRLKILPRTLTDEELFEKAQEKLKKQGKLKDDKKKTNTDPALKIHEDPEAFQEALALANMRLEVSKELLFCLPILIGMIAGGYLVQANWFESLPDAGIRAVMTLGAVLVGVLVGGGMIWGTRIFGTLLFGREAMGLGDTYIMAVIGAFCGWELTIVAFFLAPFSGLLYAMVASVLRSITKRSFMVIPYGPHLSMGALLAWVVGPYVLNYFGPKVAILVATLGS